MMKKIVLFFLFFINVVFANNLSIVVDAEIEDFLKRITKPIIKSANLNFDDIKFYIVNDKNINAFVSGGQNIFVNTGTLTTFNTPDAVLGILAHEIGHIAGGHIARFDANIKDVKNISIASILLGVGALFAGAPDVAQFLLLGGIGVGQQNLLKFTRTQEEMADGLAIQYLENNKMSAEALLISMNIFYKEQLSLPNNAEFFMTHPLSRNRKEMIENKIKQETYRFSNTKFNKSEQMNFDFIKAKILAYNGMDYSKLQGDFWVYANAIKTNSLQNVDFLIKKYPNNPYFYELKADILLKKNDVENSLKNYFYADNLLKNNLLIKKTAAFIVIKYKQKQYYKNAISHLKYVNLINSDDYGVLKLLAEAYFLNEEKDKSKEYLLKYKEIKDEIEKK
ncbi:MAG: M48 family metalloprotease [Rickettsiales bacterium]|jgi:predicted Zn-dependent protease|nr:M48 family metalloprotease [Rickettsiales bacterium]